MKLVSFLLVLFSLTQAQAGWSDIYGDWCSQDLSKAMKIYEGHEGSPLLKIFTKEGGAPHYNNVSYGYLGLGASNYVMKVDGLDMNLSEVMVHSKFLSGKKTIEFIFVDGSDEVLHNNCNIKTGQEALDYQKSQN